MCRTCRALVCGILAVFWVSAFGGCQKASTSEGIHVMFEGKPKLYYSEVYFRGQVVGAVQDQASNGSASRITVQIDPRFEQHAGQHWAFYVDKGRLTADRLTSSGEPVAAGDPMCGFNSKAAFNWFKVKTILSDRIAEANRRAQKLYQRFAQSA